MTSELEIRRNIRRAEQFIADYDAAINIWKYHVSRDKAISAVNRLQALRGSACKILVYWQGAYADWIQS